MSKIPVVLCGKIESHITGTSKMLLPDYDVIHVCRSLEAATTEIPAILKDDAIQPSSGYGSNYNSPSPVPGSKVKAIIVGGGYSPADFETIKAVVTKVVPMIFFRADNSRSPPGQVGSPTPEKIFERLIAAMDEAAKEGGGEWKAGVYPF